MVDEYTPGNLLLRRIWVVFAAPICIVLTAVFVLVVPPLEFLRLLAVGLWNRHPVRTIAAGMPPCFRCTDELWKETIPDIIDAWNGK